MKRKSRKLKLNKTVIRMLNSEGMKPAVGGTVVPDGYGFSLNRNNCRSGETC